MWEIYDHIITEIPEDLSVKNCLMGLHWTLVRSVATGVAMTTVGTRFHHSDTIAGRITGMPVHMLAKQVKSWDFLRASLGMAAINSVLNAPERIERVTGCSINAQQEVDAFEFLGELMRGKKVAVIGHFKRLARFADTCELSILERNPQPGDFPDPACEDLLPRQDIVFMTGSTMINKTLPRLLELSKDAYVVLVGPSTPFAPVLFDYGVDMLAGTVVVDDTIWRVAAEGGSRRDFGKRVLKFNIKRSDIRTD